MRNPFARPAAGPSTLPDRLLGALSVRGDYRARLDEALDVLKHITERPDAYLYVAEPGDVRFHLEHTRARPAADPSRPAPEPGETAQEGGAEWSVPTPAFEISRAPEDAKPRTVSSHVGPLWSFPVTGGDGALLALLRAGPAAEGDVPAEVVARYEQVAPAMAVVIAQARREEELRVRLAAAEAQIAASRRLAGSAVDLERMVALLLDLALSGTRTEAGFVAMRDGARLSVVAESGMPEGFADRVDLSPETGMFDWSAAEGGALFLRDPAAAEGLGVRSLLAVPLMEGRTPLGIFALVTFSAGAELGEEDLALLEAFGDQIRLMLHNAQVFESFGERYLETVKGLARALDARRAETAGHHRLVSDIAAAIAAEAGLDPDAVDAVATAGLIHDVGLAGSAEGGWAADVEHPTIGASLVAHLPLHPGVAEAVATHHEWFDGWGFPNGLKGEAIAPEGRALAAAEFIVELTTPDAVRPGWEDARLAEELRHRRGSQFDPAIADAALRILERGELPLPEREASA